jgi:hypothetical protein
MWKRLPQDHLAVHKESLFISTLSNWRALIINSLKTIK